MEQIAQIVGNTRDDTDLADSIATHDREGTLERVVMAADQRRKSRLRVETDAGTDIGLVPDRPLRSGDVLVLDDDRAIVVEFESREAAVVELPEPTAATLEAAVELGHRVGNQHWNLAVHDGTVYVPVAADRHIIENVLADSLPTDTTISYEKVDAGRWIDDETGRTDSHAGHGDHSHGPLDHAHDAAGHDHSHSAPDHDHSGSGGDHQ